ncbi:ubiquinone/menaquinone biosynthesis C-methylase UbiE [Arthrobacter sp. UYCu512]|uniref:class I SAM-dependent methyltransferase n=1 Tax=Arthrobacter sp. UYCu512 TaxID=3156338 RepID=UPI003393EC75
MENSRITSIIRTYRKRAARYDFTANLYYLFGYREWKYRRLAVEPLDLQPGDKVLELGCGTGLNFSFFQQYIGAAGQIIGVDITDAMLQQAQKRVTDHKWTNVTLIQHDAATFQSPTEANAGFSSYALSIFPETEQALRNIVNSLAPGGRLVLLELQIPTSWPSLVASAAVALMKPYAVTDEWALGRPWELIRKTAEEVLTNVEVTNQYFGFTYILSGRQSGQAKS